MRSNFRFTALPLLLIAAASCSQQKPASAPAPATGTGPTAAPAAAPATAPANRPAGAVFKNVQVLKDMPAGRFVVLMDSTWGRSLNRNCTDCHIANQWASDSLNRKKTARMMAGMVEAINTEQLTKLPVRPDQQSARISCITCHRGNPGGPGQALMP